MRSFEPVLAAHCADRVRALGGQIAISSHAGSGTSLLVTMPLELK
jgi:signal transduction histidine kinase